VAGEGGIEVSWLGRMSFDDGLRLQEESVAAGPGAPERLLLLEHDPVFTTGRGGDPANRPDPDGPFGGVPLRRVGRGGDATFHGPGQLVGYALLDFEARGGDAHRLLRALEGGLIDLLATRGLVAGRVAGRTGVWVGSPGEIPRKIAAIGVGVRRGRSMHGFALNVSIDLAPFAAIVPCGIEGVVTTSLAAEGLRPIPTVREVALDAARTLPRAIEDRLPRLAAPAEAP